MTRETVISNFNTHDQLDEAEDEGGDGVVELFRAPDRRDIWPPTLSIQLLARPTNPYDRRGMVSYGPLLRCTASRSCEPCRMDPCGPSDDLCRACVNGDFVYCLHRFPCAKWSDSQVELFHRHQDNHLTNNLSGSISPSSLMVHRNPPPPHHALPPPQVGPHGSPYTSTPGARPPRGYLQPASVSPLQPPLSDILQQDSLLGAAALTQATSVVRGTITSTGTAADHDPLSAYGQPRPPASSTGTRERPPRPPPPSSTEEPLPPYSDLVVPTPPASRSGHPRSSADLSSVPFSTFSQGVRPKVSLGAAVSNPSPSDDRTARARTVRWREPCATVSNLEETQGSAEMLLSHSLEENLPVPMDLETLWIRVESFAGTRDNREHRYLDHCITQYLLCLDDIDVRNYPELRESTRRTIQKLNELGRILDQRCSLAAGAQPPVTPPGRVSPVPMNLQQALLEAGNDDPPSVQSSLRPRASRPIPSGGNPNSRSLAESLGLGQSQAAQYDQSILNEQQAIIDQGLMTRQNALGQGDRSQTLLPTPDPVSPPHVTLMWPPQNSRPLQSGRGSASMAAQATPSLSSTLGLSTAADPSTQAEPPRPSLQRAGGAPGVADLGRRTNRAAASAAAAAHRNLLRGGPQAVPYPGTSNQTTTYRGNPQTLYPFTVQPAAYPSQPAQPDFSIPIGLLIDRLEALGERPQSAAPQGRLRQTSLPEPKYSPSGQISGLEFFRWLHLFVAAIERMGLSHPVCHNELATNKKILPQELRTLAGEAPDLKSALVKIQSRFPPKSSIYPELYREIQDIPRCTTNQERIERSGNLIASLRLMLNWFPGRDLMREDVIYAVHMIEGEAEGSVTMLYELNEIDRRHDLPPNDPQHCSYIQALMQRLDRLRQLWSDLDASLSIAGRKAVVPSMTSFAAGITPQGKEKEPKTKGPSPPNNKKNQNNPKTPKTTKPDPAKTDPNTCKCFICRKPGEKKEAKEHAPWSCPSLSAIRAKQTIPPKSLCLQCCKEKKEGKTHRPDCHMSIFQDKKTNAEVKLDRCCLVHSSPEKGYVHQKLCTECGVNLPPPKPKLPPVISMAMSLEGQGAEITRCAFMTEVVTVIEKGGKRLSARVQYDSLGGGNFASGVSPTANHGAEGRTTEPFALNTLTGTHEYCLPLTLLLLDTPDAGKLWLDFMVTTFPDGGYIELDEMTRRRCDIYKYTEREINTCEVKLILGVAHSSYFPQPIVTPACLSHRYPGLTLWRSRLSGKILFQGAYQPSFTHMASFFSMPTEIEDYHGELLPQPLIPTIASSPPTPLL